MEIIHRLVGYDRQTDRMLVQFDIPVHLMPEVKKIARVPADDPDAVWSYPLTTAGARKIASLIGIELAAKDAEFFLEAGAIG
jgi:hypothetical protein